ncbi:unnamed protein product [Prorocentrum cordatum]|uniref:ISXO2-like transposase domain-containing protein n=1 Tax=Prorocentrum cordatum TaxID=2364126 RepID=A0ABN9US13_9DINO|nr:unnamed protein product [Polarella glacialis]
MKRPAGAMKRPAGATIPTKKMMSKRSDKAFRPFPVPKRGKGIMGRDQSAMKQKKKKNSMKEDMVSMLIEDNILIDWSGRICPHCGQGKLGNRRVQADGAVKWQCNSGRRRGKQVGACHGHPVFSDGNGQSKMSLMNKIHLLLNVNHKAIERMSKYLDAARQRFVEKKEEEIVFGGDKEWVDVEADETVFRAALSADKKTKEWEQWAGCVERGRPQSLVLRRTNNDTTVPKAPGPGAITKSDWKPFLLSRLHHHKVILHSDGAKSYNIRADGVLHDWVVHARKRKTICGKWVWLKPAFTKLVRHKLPEGGSILVKGGTQIVDRAWQFLKEHIGSRTLKPKSRALASRIRSGQWEHWNKGNDLWVATGDMIYEEMGGVY